ncbi:MAG: transcriptional repressor [Gammaproteobacteria bacterium]|nr:transcriptional repressor [Gammaproteobacteria bacterium]MBJ54057.1 transcriptional repressor [Gammaproteobacteria bacterium]HBN14822.1 transcriptional repressor [Pseudohongiella sp.]|tara:strand:- start:431 stop:910 length:480 start_codon:yes stop_codon:yes gene_type:complete
MISDIDKTLEHAQQICTQQGVRLTEKRRRVLQVVLESAEPLSAYQIADNYRDHYGKTLSVMSVYRMLNFLKDNELVHRLETTNQYLPCSHIRCQHDHEVPQFLICDSCKGVEEVGIRKEILSELSANIKDTGFTLARQQLEFRGICSACQRTGATLKLN